MRFRRPKEVFIIGLLLLAASKPRAGEQADPPAAGEQAVGLNEFLAKVVVENESIQAKALDWLASRSRTKGAKGVFEPALVGGFTRAVNSKQNTAQEQLSLGGASILSSTSNSFFSERNYLYDAGIESILPTGGKLKLGYTVRDLWNNYQLPLRGYEREYDSFAGLTLTQPLLKNGGYGVTMAGIRLAAAESEVAFQDYRRQLMLMLAKAEATYWELFFAEEQEAIRSDSLRIAQKLLEDNRVRLQAGKGSELEVLQAEAGVAQRRAYEREASQRRTEIMFRLMAMSAGSAPMPAPMLRTTDRPRVREQSPEFFEAICDALLANPDYLSQKHRIEQENIRVAYARNQVWPQLDLKATYGLNGLSTTMEESWRKAWAGDYDTWSVGFELRVPLLGEIKGRNDYKASRMRQKSALVTFKATETELMHSLNTALQRLTSTRENVTNYHQVVEFNQRLLETSLVKLETGKTDSRKILEIEEGLAEARSAATESLVNSQKALIEFEFLRGSTLKSRNLEISKSELEKRTFHLLRNGTWGAEDYAALRRKARAEFERQQVLRADPPQEPESHGADAVSPVPDSPSVGGLQPISPSAPRVTTQRNQPKP